MLMPFAEKNYVTKIVWMAKLSSGPLVTLYFYPKPLLFLRGPITFPAVLIWDFHKSLLWKWNVLVRCFSLYVRATLIQDGSLHRSSYPWHSINGYIGLTSRFESVHQRSPNWNCSRAINGPIHGSRIGMHTEGSSLQWRWDYIPALLRRPGLYPCIRWQSRLQRMQGCMSWKSGETIENVS